MFSAQMAIVGFIAGLAIVFTTGRMLSSRGRPYGAVLFNIHKLVDLALVAAVFVLIGRAEGFPAFSGGVWVSVGLFVLVVIQMFATGALLSTMREPPAWVFSAHKAGPWVGFGLAIVLVLLVLTGIIAEPETVLERILAP